MRIERAVASRSFNPHPPLRADAIAITPPEPGGPPVSILTRPYGRMLCGQPTTLVGLACFNPHPPLRADAMATPSLRSWRITSFNPHPPLRADAMVAEIPMPTTAVTFQSSPALTGGCYTPQPSQVTIAVRFNPHPPLRADAISLHSPNVPSLDVSILTRPYGRMLFFLTQALDLPGVFSPFPRSPLWQVWNLHAGDQG